MSLLDIMMIKMRLETYEISFYTLEFFFFFSYMLLSCYFIVFVLFS